MAAGAADFTEAEVDTPAVAELADDDSRVVTVAAPHLLTAGAV
jgi:hypothetical protein